MNDYSRIAVTIHYLEENYSSQPTLAELAAHVGLSESHFHRLFRRWAGSTPKEFLQCLTVEHAKDRLRESASVLDAALDTGLSGPGRLHDLFVKIEAASPGEFKSGGAGMSIGWGTTESPFGTCLIAWSERGICHLSFAENDEVPTDPPEELIRDWWAAEFFRNDQEAAKIAEPIFEKRALNSKGLNVFVRATPFQLKAWRALLRIPEGDLASYRTIAERIHSPAASRAVGTACGANRVGYLIPCHRVIRETGVVRGYRWGSTRKRAMLAWESCKA